MCVILLLVLLMKVNRGKLVLRALIRINNRLKTSYYGTSLEHMTEKTTLKNSVSELIKPLSSSEGQYDFIFLKNDHDYAVHLRVRHSI